MIGEKNDFYLKNYSIIACGFEKLFSLLQSKQTDKFFIVKV
jgi:hypothetical protein